MPDQSANAAELDQDVPAPPPGPGRALGGLVGGGMTWMLVTTLAAKIATAGSQWVLAWKLLPDDFGVFAKATAIAGFLMVCRDVGIREYLIARGKDRFADEVSSGFWLAFVYNCLVCLIIAAAGAYFVQTGDARLGHMLFVMGGALPIGSLCAVQQAKLRQDMRFGTFCMITGASAVVRQVASIAFVLMGFGYMSMAWPVLVATIVEAALGVFVTGNTFWSGKPDVHRWRGMMRHCKWLMFGSLSNFALDWGPFLVLNPVLNVANSVVGLVYFGFQMTAQIGVLLSWNLQTVLMPVLVALQDEKDRLRGAMVRSLRALMLVGSLASLGLTAIAIPLVHLLWPTRKDWHESVLVIMILGVFFPWRVTFGLCASVLMAQNRFKRYAILTMLEGVGFTLATVIGYFVFVTLEAKDMLPPMPNFPLVGVQHAEASIIALAAGLWLLVSRFTITWWIMQQNGVSLRDVFRATVPPWLVATIAGLSAVGLGIWLDSKVDLDAWLLAHTSLLGGSEDSTRLRIVADGLRLMVTGGSCVIIFTVLCRLLLTQALREAIGVMPSRLRPLANKALLLNSV